MRRRYVQSHVSCNVDIEVSEILGELSVEDLREELQRRTSGAQEDFEETYADELLRCLRRGDFAEAIVMLERTIHPKYKSTVQCAKAIEKLKENSAGHSLRPR